VVELFESVPNFSEGRDRFAVDAIAKAAAGAHLLDVDPDPDHHRVVVSLAGTGDRLSRALVAGVAEAAARIDLGAHAGVHPRVGAADVVPIVPLGATSLDACHELARDLGGAIWSELHIPVFFYGHGEKLTLADIRAGRAQPDLGGPDVHPTAGAVCVGARRPLVAFNVLLPRSTVAEARALARSIRERASGIRGVQALVFELSGGRVQLSMNLFRVDETKPDDVIAALERRGVVIGDQQVVGLCPAEAANSAAAGRLLEARLGAAGARAGASLCRARGGFELEALARRLEREAGELGTLTASQEEVLGGAERCAALTPVMRAAGVPDAEVTALALTAARGLRRAIRPETGAAFPERLAALDTRLESLLPA
jgi:glutamate formiminotransferase